MNKKQYEQFHYLKEVNAFLRKNNSPSKLVAEKNTWGDYQLKWQCEAGNLPEKLKELKHSKALHEIFIKQKREVEIANFLKD